MKCLPNICALIYERLHDYVRSYQAGPKYTLSITAAETRSQINNLETLVLGTLRACLTREVFNVLFLTCQHFAALLESGKFPCLGAVHCTFEFIAVIEISRRFYAADWLPFCSSALF